MGREGVRLGMMIGGCGFRLGCWSLLGRVLLNPHCGFVCESVRVVSGEGGEGVGLQGEPWVGGWPSGGL